tara:strand:- start:56 stop:520 length:465 start_codon:yes stop_codon:yes gene_type:complete
MGLSNKYGARKFNQGSYNHSDKYAKDLFIKYILNKGHKIYDSEENYNHDIITIKNNNKYYFELETKSNYPFTTYDTFPFNSVSFLGRKERLHKIQEFHYIIICRETEWAVCCNSKKIFKKQYLENLDINTLNRKGKDQMFRVPKYKCNFFNLNK